MENIEKLENLMNEPQAPFNARTSNRIRMFTSFEKMEEANIVELRSISFEHRMKNLDFLNAIAFQTQLQKPIGELWNKRIYFKDGL